MFFFQIGRISYSKLISGITTRRCHYFPRLPPRVTGYPVCDSFRLGAHGDRGIEPMTTFDREYYGDARSRSRPARRKLNIYRSVQPGDFARRNVKQRSRTL